MAEIDDATLKTNSNIRIVADNVTINDFSSNSAVLSRIENIANLPGGPPDLTIDAMNYTDSSGVVLDAFALDENGGFVSISGSGFSKSMNAFIGTHVSPSISIVSTTKAIIAVPPLPFGTYDLKLKRSDGGTVIKANAVKISKVPDITLKNNELATAYQFEPYERSLEIERDSDLIIYAPNLPTGLVATAAGNVQGVINDELYDTIFSFDVTLTDQENQTITETVNLPYKKRHLAQTLGTNDSSRRICFATDVDIAIAQNSFYLDVFSTSNYNWAVETRVPVLFAPHFVCISPDGAKIVRARDNLGDGNRFDNYEYNQVSRTYVQINTLNIPEYSEINKSDLTHLSKNPFLSNSGVLFVPQENSILIVGDRVSSIVPPQGQPLFGQLVASSDSGEVLATCDSSSGSSVFGKGQLFVYKTDTNQNWVLKQMIEHPQKSIGFNVAISGDGKVLATATSQQTIIIYVMEDGSFIEHMEIEDAFDTTETHIALNYNGSCLVSSTKYIRTDLLNKLYTEYDIQHRSTLQGTAVQINNSGELIFGLDDAGNAFISHYVSLVDRLIEI